MRKKVRGAEGKGRREKGERKLENAEEREREKENNKINIFCLHLMNSEVVYTQLHCSRLLRTFGFSNPVRVCFYGFGG